MLARPSYRAIGPAVRAGGLPKASSKHVQASRWTRAPRGAVAITAARPFADDAADQERLAAIDKRIHALEHKGQSSLVSQLAQAAPPAAPAEGAPVAPSVKFISTADPWRTWRDSEQVGPAVTEAELVGIKELEKKIIWLATYMVYSSLHARLPPPPAPRPPAPESHPGPT